MMSFGSPHTARLEQMTRDRLRIQQFPLTLRPTLHPTIIPNNTGQQADRHAALFRAPLDDVPQGNLAERLRAAGAGIGAFFSPPASDQP